MVIFVNLTQVHEYDNESGMHMHCNNDLYKVLLGQDYSESAIFISFSEKQFPPSIYHARILHVNTTSTESLILY